MEIHYIVAELHLNGVFHLSGSKLVYKPHVCMQIKYTSLQPR